MQIFFIILIFLWLNSLINTENLELSFILASPVKNFRSLSQNKYCHDNNNCGLSSSTQNVFQKRKRDAQKPIDCSVFIGCKQCTDNGCILCFKNYVLDNTTYTCSKKKKKLTTIQIILIIACPITFLLIINVIIVLLLFRKKKKKISIKNFRFGQVAEDNSNDITKSNIGSASKMKTRKTIIINQSLSNSKSLILNQSVGVNSSNSNVLSHIIETNQFSIKNHRNLTEKQPDYCSVCHKERSFICLSCNCGLCYNHYLEYMKDPNKNKICPRHKIKLKGSFYIKINDECKKNDLPSTDKITIKKPLSKRFDEDLNFKCDYCGKINNTIHKTCDNGCSLQICSNCSHTLKGKLNVCPKCKNNSINK